MEEVNHDLVSRARVAFQKKAAARVARCGSEKAEKRPRLGVPSATLLGLPVLRRLRTRLDALEIGIRTVGARGRARFLRRHFLPFGLFLGASFLALAFALAFLL